MSKRAYISRYLLILKKLSTQSYVSYEELKAYLSYQFELLQLQDDTIYLGFSKRTLQRDIREIQTIFGIDIAYSREYKGYYIREDKTEKASFQRLLETFHLFTSLQVSKDIDSFVFLDNRKAKGTEHILGILHAIQNEVKLQFTYHKFWEEQSSERSLNPYAIKEFKNRWYVIGKDNGDNLVKTFGLDRISDLEITSQAFKKSEDYDVKEAYQNNFGILSNEEKPEKVILSFTPVQGKYVKSLPLHSSQQVIAESSAAIQIQLQVRITYDLLMEIISYGKEVKVLAPESLIEQVKQAHAAALKQYE